MHRYKLTIEYDGTNFSGWQRQSNVISIQEEIEEAIYKFTSENVRLFASGRTDAGVHAIAQVAHFDLIKDLKEDVILRAINHFVKPDISIINCSLVGNDFHARFSTKYRQYKYIITNRKTHLSLNRNRAWQVRDFISIDLMKEASNYLIGTHDFTSFRSVMCQANSPIRTIDSILINNCEDSIFIDIKAKSFLHHMVRNIVGTLKLVGTKKLIPSDTKTILDAKDRSKAGPTAPACGLYLTEIIY